MGAGTLYVVGVGPGDPELLTLKAVRILKKVPCLCIPKGREEGSSLALSILQRAMNLDNKELIEAYFPMKKTKDSQQSTNLCEIDTRWQQAIESILSKLNKGIDVAFITLGDPSIYSTFFYLYDSLLELSPELHIEIIPGVSSINAAASKAKMSLSLADEKIAIIPAAYFFRTEHGIQPSTASLSSVLVDFDTVVLMKVHKVFDNILKTLNEMNLLNNAVYVLKTGMEDEKIFNNIRDVKEQDLNYFSMVIVKK
ncbi:MAG: precorrin-2 C(20)-methyltransferase [Nitrospirae bacterium]|nr:precorrin-2 C(20)-methyltransferase [Nitrospirota bacterium]